MNYRDRFTRCLTRQLIALIVVSFSIIASLLTPQALGQIYTTVTGQTTSASPVVYTETQSSPLYSYTTTTTAQGAFLSEYITHTANANGYCNWNAFDFLAVAGQVISGTVSANVQNTLIVFILSDQDYNVWLQPSNNYCEPTSNGNVAVQWSEGSLEAPLTQVEVSWTAPSTGRFYFVIETNSNEPDLVSANISTQKPYQETVLVYSTSYLTGTNYITRTMPTQTVEYSPIFYLIAAVCIALVVSGLFYARTHRAKPMRKRKSAEKTVPCVKCCIELPAGAKFCDNCGAEQRRPS